MKWEFPDPSGFLQNALQRSVDLVAFGLQASDNAQPVNLMIPGSFGQVSPAENRSLSVDEVRSEFRTWVLANGLRYCVEAIGPTLEWVRKTCFLWTRPGTITPLNEGKLHLSAQFSGEDWNTHIIRGAAKFDRLPLPDKLLHLQETFGWQRPELAQHVLSINAARNCLAHRHGIVGKADLKLPSDDSLVVRWRQLRITAGVGPKERVVESGSRIEAGETVSVTFVDSEKRILLGEKLIFSAPEYVDICLTFMLFANQLGASIKELQDRRRPSAAGPD